MDDKNNKNLYDEILEIFKNKGYNVDEFVETLEVDNLEKKLDEALNELKNKFKSGRINASNYKNNRMLEIASEKLPKRKKKSSNSEKETISITETEEIENQ